MPPLHFFPIHLKIIFAFFLKVMQCCIFFPWHIMKFLKVGMCVIYHPLCSRHSVNMCLLKWIYVIFSYSLQESREQILDLLIDTGAQFSLLNCTDSLTLQLSSEWFLTHPSWSSHALVTPDGWHGLWAAGWGTHLPSDCTHHGWAGALCQDGYNQKPNGWLRR